MAKKVAAAAAEEAPTTKKVKPGTKAPAVAETKKPEKKAKVEKEDNTTSLKELCEELGIDPRSARVKLRKEYQREEGGRWAWPTGSKELAKVRKILETVEEAEAA